MTAAKINSLILPLLLAILLSTASKLNMGKSINAFFYAITSPIHSPISSLRLFTENKIGYIKNLPKIEKQNRELKVQAAHYITENEYLKQKITDQKTLDNLKSSYKEVLPVRLTGSTGKFTVSSSQPSDKVKFGQPLVSGNVLLGLVSDIKGVSYTITPLDSDKINPFAVRTSSGLKGIFKHSGQTPQISDVPSQNPLVLGDFIISEPNEFLPGNLLIGKTTRIISTSQEPLQKAEILLYDTLDNNPDNLAIITTP